MGKRLSHDMSAEELGDVQKHDKVPNAGKAPGTFWKMFFSLMGRGIQTRVISGLPEIEWLLVC